MSLHWNPSTDDQAVSRCTRPGQVKFIYLTDDCIQKHKVKVFKLLATSKKFESVDFKVHKIQQRKKQEMEEIFKGGSQPAKRKLTKQLIDLIMD